MGDFTLFSGKYGPFSAKIKQNQAKPAYFHGTFFIFNFLEVKMILKSQSNSYFDINRARRAPQARLRGFFFVYFFWGQIFLIKIGQTIRLIRADLLKFR